MRCPVCSVLEALCGDLSVVYWKFCVITCVYCIESFV